MFNFGFGGMGMDMEDEMPARNVDNSKLYNILGVPKDASDADIKKAFRKLAMVHHPDKGGNHEKFQEIQNAYEVLSDPEKRASYDKYGEDGPQAGGHGGMDIFDLFGGGGRRRGPTGPKRGEDVNFQFKLSLEEMYNGCQKKVRITRNIICDGCHGKGGNNITTCGPCQGRGMKTQIKQVGPGMITQRTVPCTNCNGTGQCCPEKDKCTKCRGNKVVEHKSEIEVNVPRGANNDDTQIFKGQADEAPNTIAGDLIVVFKLNEHSQFVRNGKHLIYKKKISLSEALCGLKFNIQHLDKRNIYIETKPGQFIITPTHMLKIEDEGMYLNGGTNNGNLYVDFEIVFPDKLNNDQVKAIKSALPPVNDIPKPDKVEDIHFELVNRQREMEKIVSDTRRDESRRQNQRSQHAHDDDEEHYERGQPTCQQA